MGNDVLGIGVDVCILGEFHDGGDGQRSACGLVAQSCF